MGQICWVVSTNIERTLGGFHNRVVWRLTGRMPQRNLDGTWMYPSLDESMLEAGVQEVETYVACRQNTAVIFIETRPIMDLCLVAA